MYQDGDTKDYFIKRFNIETTTVDKEFKFINDNKGTRLLLVSTAEKITFKFNYYSKNGRKKEKIINVSEFVGIKGWKSIGNKIPTYKRMSGFSLSEHDIEICAEDKENENGDTLNLFQ